MTEKRVSNKQEKWWVKNARIILSQSSVKQWENRNVGDIINLFTHGSGSVPVVFWLNPDGSVQEVVEHNRIPAADARTVDKGFIRARLVRIPESALWERKNLDSSMLEDFDVFMDMAKGKQVVAAYADSAEVFAGNSEIIQRFITGLSKLSETVEDSALLFLITGNRTDSVFLGSFGQLKATSYVERQPVNKTPSSLVQQYHDFSREAAKKEESIGKITRGLWSYPGKQKEGK